MKPSEVSGHWCLVVLNLKFRRFECLDSLRDETCGDAVRFLRNMTDNIKKLWRESSVDRAKPFSLAHIDGFSCEFVWVPQQENTCVSVFNDFCWLFLLIEDVVPIFFGFCVVPFF